MVLVNNQIKNLRLEPNTTKKIIVIWQLLFKIQCPFLFFSAFTGSCVSKCTHWANIPPAKASTALVSLIVWVQHWDYLDYGFILKTSLSMQQLPVPWPFWFPLVSGHYDQAIDAVASCLTLTVTPVYCVMPCSAQPYQCWVHACAL